MLSNDLLMMFIINEWFINDFELVIVIKCYLKWDFRTVTVFHSQSVFTYKYSIMKWIQKSVGLKLECDIKAVILQTAAITKRGRNEYIVEKLTGNVMYTQTGHTH